MSGCLWLVYILVSNGISSERHQSGSLAASVTEARLVNTFVAYKPRFGGDSQARTPQPRWTSWRDSAGQEPAGEAQLDRGQIHCTGQVLDRQSFLMSISISSLPR
jgi:hypothetical protein